MTISRTLTVDGSYASARLTGGTVRVVLDTPPDLSVMQPGRDDREHGRGPPAPPIAAAGDAAARRLVATLGARSSRRRRSAAASPATHSGARSSAATRCAAPTSSPGSTC